jgi:glycosyltransferase involved in cell wall biosynthesis
MADVAVVHTYFGRGGAESVCMHVLDALGDDHDLTLFTMSDVDPPALNDYFRTSVPEDLTVRDLGSVGPTLRRSMGLLDRTLGRDLGRIHGSAFARALGRPLDRGEFDLVVSTHAELSVEGPSVQYVHYPWYNRGALPPEVDDGGTAEAWYDRLCRVVAGHDDGAVRRSRLLTNSDWTAEVLERLYGTRPETLYPPVVTEEFDPSPWDERERGFVCVGRISPEKNVHRNVEVVDRLRDRGHDVTLRVVGPTIDSRYADRVERMAGRRPHVSIEGRVSRERLVELLCSHRYAIHGMEREHFGIAVAECVAAGAIPFVPDAGGQREIVEGNPTLTYGSVDDAVEKADAVLSDPVRQRELRASLPDVRTRYGPDRFRRRIRSIAHETLDGPEQEVPTPS